MAPRATPYICAAIAAAFVAISYGNGMLRSTRSKASPNLHVSPTKEPLSAHDGATNQKATWTPGSTGGTATGGSTADGKCTGDSDCSSTQYCYELTACVEKNSLLETTPDGQTTDGTATEATPDGKTTDGTATEGSTADGKCTGDGDCPSTQYCYELTACVDKDSLDSSKQDPVETETVDPPADEKCTGDGDCPSTQYCYELTACVDKDSLDATNQDPASASVKTETVDPLWKECADSCKSSCPEDHVSGSQESETEEAKAKAEEAKVSLQSCNEGCLFPFANFPDGRVAGDDVDEYCQTLSLPDGVDFKACKKAVDGQQRCVVAKMEAKDPEALETTQGGAKPSKEKSSASRVLNSVALLAFVAAVSQ